jgi:CBS domain-containing protein
MLKVKDLMTHEVVSVHPSTSLKDVARLLVEHRVSGLPVVDDHGAVVGVVSEGDLVAKEQGRDAVERRPLAAILGDSKETRSQLAKVDAGTAGEAMTAPVVTTRPDAYVVEAAALMTRRQVNRLPVLDGDRLVGVISRADVVRAFVQSDNQIADSVRQDVLRDTLWLDNRLFDVKVNDGVVTIEGRAGRRSTAEMIERFAGMVPGVLAVDSKVTWDTDDRDIQAPERDLFSLYGDR